MSQKEHRFRNWKNTKFSSVAWIMAILVLVIAVVINMIIARLDFSWDISPNKQYSLSSTTESYLDELDQKGVTVDFYLLSKLDDLEKDTESLSLYRALLAYSAHDCINLISFDPNKDDATMEKINSDNAYTLSTGDMVFVCGDSKKRLPGSSMYRTTTDSDGNVTDESFEGENLITGTIKGVAEGYTPTVYFLTGHGEKNLDQYSTFTTNLINYNYEAKTLNLSELDAVPDDTALVLVAGPTADITDSERAKLETYLEKAMAGIPENFSGKLLEVPVGTGILTMPLYKTLPKADITCLDYSADMMGQAQEKADRLHLKNVTFRQGDVGALPFADGAFDIVLSLNGFHTFPDKEAAYREVFRVLRPGGTFCGCFYVKGEQKRTDWFVRHIYEKTGFFTPPYETAFSLKKRLEKRYATVTLETVKSMAWFVCRKAE